MGASTVFGIPGVHTLEIYRGLGRSGLRHVAPRHEQGAGFMADGWARVSGEPGVCTLIGGPGLTNAITPIAQAYHDSIPLLVISGAVPDRERGLGEIHDLPDQQALMATVTAFSHTVRDPAELPGVFGRAPRGVRVPSAPARSTWRSRVDVLGQPAPEPGPVAAPPPRPRAAEADIDRAARLLAGARRPLVLLGGGARDAGTEALALARRLGAPIGLTINARGTVPHDDQLCLGSALSFEPIAGLLRDADATLLVGAELSDLDLWGLDAPLELRGLVRIDIDPDQLRAPLARRGSAVRRRRRDAGALWPRALPGDVDADARAATRAARVARGTCRRCGRRRRSLASRRCSTLLDRVLPADRIIAGDSTQPVYAANHLLPMAHPRSWLMPIGYGCLGCALPMAIGAKLAAPERPVLAHRRRRRLHVHDPGARDGCAIWACRRRARLQQPRLRRDPRRDGPRRDRPPGHRRVDPRPGRDRARASASTAIPVSNRWPELEANCSPRAHRRVADGDRVRGRGLTEVEDACTRAVADAVRSHGKKRTTRWLYGNRSSLMSGFEDIEVAPYHPPGSTRPGRRRPRRGRLAVGVAGRLRKLSRPLGLVRVGVAASSSGSGSASSAAAAGA